MRFVIKRNSNSQETKKSCGLIGRPAKIKIKNAIHARRKKKKKIDRW